MLINMVPRFDVPESMALAWQEGRTDTQVVRFTSSENMGRIASIGE